VTAGRGPDTAKMVTEGRGPDTAKPVLEALDLSCNRGNHQILDIDRLSFPEGSIVAMIGDNGCGKSTLAETLCGVIPSSGSIAFDETYLTDKQRAKRSFMVMQDVNRQLFSDSVIEEVMMNAPMGRDEALQVLDDLGLADAAERHPASLSGGQKQRVAIASALCAGKEIIFYDEPTSVLPFIAVYGLIDKAVSGAQITLKGSLATIVFVFLCETIYAVFYSLGLQLSHRAAYGTLENIRLRLQDRMEAQPLGYVLDMGTGAVKKMFTEDIEAIEIMLAHVIPEGIANLAVPAAVLIAMIAVDWQTAVLTFIMIGFGISASGQMYTVGMDKMGSYFAAAKRLNNTVIEYVDGMEVVRVFGREGNAGEKFGKAVKGYRDFALDWYKVCWPWMALYGSIFSNVAIYTIPFGAAMILMGHMSLSRYILTLCLSFADRPAPCTLHEPHGGPAASQFQDPDAGKGHRQTCAQDQRRAVYRNRTRRHI